MHLVRWCILAVAESSALTSRGMALTGMRRQDRVSATSRSVHGSWAISRRGRHLDGCWLHGGCMAPAHHCRKVQQGPLRPVGQHLQTHSCLQVILYLRRCASGLVTR